MKKNVWISILAGGTIIYAVLQIMTSIPLIGYIGSVALAGVGFMTVVSVLEDKERKKAEIEAEAERLHLESKKADEYERCIKEIEDIVYECSYLRP